MTITDTRTFRKALASDNPADVKAAEVWLRGIVAKPVTDRKAGYDERWQDHREGEIFDRYCDLRDWSSAKRIVEMSIMPDSQAGRIAKLVRLAGKVYTEIV